MAEYIHELRSWPKFEWSHDKLAGKLAAVRHHQGLLHHRLVWIHPFPNGNGRLSRMAADLLAAKLGQSRFTWGSGKLIAIADLRRRYVESLRAADARDIAPLITFARA